MSRLYTALERHNAAQPKADSAKPPMEPSTESASPVETAKSPDPLLLPPDLASDGTAPEAAKLVTLPRLLIDSSPGFRREIALLHRSLAMAARPALNSILICSAESGAGTSSIALNIAAYASAETTGKALLIEANFEHPYIHRWTNGARPGLSDLLANQGSLEQYINPASTIGLDIMSVGRITDASDTLVLESRVRYLLSELQPLYPLVVVDGAPVNSSHSTLELAKAVDGVILIARPNTLKKSVMQARTALENVGANTLGFAFNDF